MRIVVVALTSAVLVACTTGAPSSVVVESREAGTSRLQRTGEIPCAPRAVLEAVCHNCHSDPPRNGAPFSQMTYADIERDLDGEPVYVRMRRAVEDGRMPLDPYTLTDEQKTTLLDWLEADAPPAPLGTVCPPP